MSYSINYLRALRARLSSTRVLPRASRHKVDDLVETVLLTRLILAVAGRRAVLATLIGVRGSRVISFVLLALRDVVPRVGVRRADAAVRIDGPRRRVRDERGHSREQGEIESPLHLGLLIPETHC